MRTKNLILSLLTTSILFSFFLFPSIAIENPDYIEVIKPGYAIYFSFTLTQNDELEIEFEVTEGANKDVNFYILDSENYDKWDNHETFSYVIFRSRAVYANIKFIVPANDKFYVIFSNSFSIITSKTVEIDFTLTISSDSNKGVDIPIFIWQIPMIIIITAVVLIILIFSITRHNRRQIPKKKIIIEKQERTTKIQNLEISKKILCPLCGEEILDEKGDYCSKCGGNLQ